MDIPTEVLGAAGDRANAPYTLLVSGWIHLGAPGDPPVAVRRTMPIVGRDGTPMGTVAAVVVDQATQQTTHLLLGRGHPDLEYRLVPLSVIERVEAESIQLRIASQDISRLTRRSTSPSDAYHPQE